MSKAESNAEWGHSNTCVQIHWATVMLASANTTNTIFRDVREIFRAALPQILPILWSQVGFNWWCLERSSPLTQVWTHLTQRAVLYGSKTLSEPCENEANCDKQRFNPQHKLTQIQVWTISHNLITRPWTHSELFSSHWFMVLFSLSWLSGQKLQHIAALELKETYN